MSKKKTTIQKAKTTGEQSPVIIAEGGHVSVNYGNSDNEEKPNPRKKTKKIRWKRVWTIIVAAIATAAGIAELSGYSIKDFIEDKKVTEKSKEDSLPDQHVETKGDNSPAVIVEEGNATFHYEESNQEQDSIAKD